MRYAIARAVMRLACHCLGAGRRDFAAAMQAEFGEAARDGRSLGFATGCLLAAWREMAMREEGRFVLTKYAVAIGMLFPMAALQLGNAFGLRAPFGADAAYGMMADQVGVNPYLASVEANSGSLVFLLWLLLGAAHVGLAWTLVAEDWSRIVRSGAVIAAAAITQTVFAGVVMLDLSALAPQLIGLAVECLAIGAVARQYVRSARLPSLPLGE